jgi:hypothetical protein
MNSNTSIGTSISEEHEKSGSVLRYVFKKVASKKSSKNNCNSDKMLDSKLDAILNRNIDKGLRMFQTNKKLQRFLIVNALLKKFHMMFQKRVEYQILFSYIKNIINFFIQNLRIFQKTSIVLPNELTVKEFRHQYGEFIEHQEELDERSMERQPEVEDDAKDMV